MADERMVPLFLDGQSVELAQTPKDFFGAKTIRKGDHEMVTAADAGYRLGDRYEDLTEYDGPKSKRQYVSQQEERRAERAAAQEPAPKAESAKAEAAKKD